MAEDVRPILVTQQQARQLGELIRSVGDVSIGAGSPAAIGTDTALVVALTAAIPAGSVDTVLADIMRLDGATWTNTGQQISVRSATGLAVSTAGRRIAKRVGRNGWIVVET